MNTVPFYQGTPCNNASIEENGRLVWRPDVVTIRAAINRTVTHYSHPVRIEWSFAPSDHQAVENIRQAAELAGRRIEQDGSTIIIA